MVSVCLHVRLSVPIYREIRGLGIGTVFDNYGPLVVDFLMFFCPFLTVFNLCLTLLTIFGCISYLYERADCWPYAAFFSPSV